MMVSEIRYDRTINLGNYENEKVGFTVSLREGDDHVEALDRAKEMVNHALGVVKEPLIKAAPVAPKKDESKKTTASKKKVTKKKASKKVVKPKNIPYSRDIKLHRDTLGVEVLSKIDDQWRVSKRTVNAAKKVSSDMVGEEFLNNEGEVLPAFFKAAKKIYDLACKNDL